MVVSEKGRTLGSGTIDPDKLIEMRISDNMTWEQIGEYFGVSPQACSQMYKRIKKESIPSLYEAGKKLADTHISVKALAAGLMGDVASIMQEVKLSIAEEDGEWDKMSIEKRRLQLATMAELRNQMAMYRDIAAEMYSSEANEEFQSIVLKYIAEVDSSVAQKIISELERRQPVRQLITATRSR